MLKLESLRVWICKTLKLGYEGTRHWIFEYTLLQFAQSRSLKSLVVTKHEVTTDN
jgi:hypothetical protein